MIDRRGRAGPDWYNICRAGDGGRVKSEFTVGIVSARRRHTASALHLFAVTFSKTDAYRRTDAQTAVVVRAGRQGHPQHGKQHICLFVSTWA